MSILDDTRADWHARPPLRALTAVPWSARVGVSWHWIGPGHGPSPDGPHYACLERVRAWQYDHQHKPGPDGPWKDIGYNVLICRHARAIEGRGLGVSGSHSPGVNVAHVGVQFMVGDGDPFPTAAMIARAHQLRADLARLGPNIRRDWAHRDDPKASTSCPGDAITSWVHAGGPTQHPTTTQEDEEMAITVKHPRTGKPVPVEEALWSMWTYILELRGTSGSAARDAAVARALAEDTAAKGRALTEAEIDAIGKRVGAEIAAGFDVELAPKEPV